MIVGSNLARLAMAASLSLVAGSLPASSARAQDTPDFAKTLLLVCGLEVVEKERRQHRVESAIAKRQRVGPGGREVHGDPGGSGFGFCLSQHFRIGVDARHTRLPHLRSQLQQKCAGATTNIEDAFAGGDPRVHQ